MDVSRLGAVPLAPISWPTRPREQQAVAPVAATPPPPAQPCVAPAPRLPGGDEAPVPPPDAQQPALPLMTSEQMTALLRMIITGT